MDQTLEAAPENEEEENKTDALARAQNHAQELLRDYADRDALLEEIDKMYFLDWEDKPKGQDFKYTVSPGPRNALLGAIRLMTSTEPKWNIPYDKNKDEAKGMSEEIEKFCSAIWYHSGRFKQEPLEQTAVNALLRYGLMVLAAYNTEDLKKQATKRGTSKAQKKQLDRLTRRTPYLIEAWDPKGVYPEWGRYGLTAVYRVTPMRVAEIKQQHGEDCLVGLLDEHTTDNDSFYYCDYWDLTWHMAWISEHIGTSGMNIGKYPIMQEKHELPYIPIVVQSADGSHIDNKREYQSLPFLYAVKESGLWDRQNLELTVMYTNLYNIGNTPLLKHVNPTEKELVLDFTVPGGRIPLDPGEELSQLQLDVISPDMLQGLDIATGLIEQSTIYSQALGQPLGANAAYSMVALLQQSGRQSLITPQKRGAWGMGEIFEIIVEIIKDDKSKDSAKVFDQSNSEILTIDKKDIPDDLIIEAILDIDLPQDTLTQANIAGMLVQQGIASRRWVREKILAIGQSDEMDQEIWTDTAGEAMFNQLLEGWIREMIQGAMNPQQGPQQGQTGMPPGGMGVPPEEQMGPPMRNPQGPSVPGTAMQTQEGLIPAQAPGEQPAPPSQNGQIRPPQEGRMR